MDCCIRFALLTSIELATLAIWSLFVTEYHREPCPPNRIFPKYTCPTDTCPAVASNRKTFTISPADIRQISFVLGAARIRITGDSGASTVPVAAILIEACGGNKTEVAVKAPEVPIYWRLKGINNHR